MTAPKRYTIALAAVFIWIGFVGAISFMEAWLKFQAPGVTLPIGLGIGRLVFAALNKVEWVLGLISCCCLFSFRNNKISTPLFCLLLLLFILIIQTVYMLPLLDARAARYISGETVPPSTIHFYYIAAEIVKLLLLFITGYELFQSTNLFKSAKHATSISVPSATL